jgi:hypothetical protein
LANGTNRKGKQMLKGKAKKAAVKEALAKRAANKGSSVEKQPAKGARVWDSENRKFVKQ